MPERYLFEYAVIRVVPRVEREEFLNVGVIVYCPKQKFLKSIITIDDRRLHASFSGINLEEVKANLLAFENICHGNLTSSPIAKLDNASRFRWLTATRSTIIQASKVHPGLCIDANETLFKLHGQLVLE
ncbi:MAG: DUF3037 domain-containing protein [Mucilaginibacter sp.]|uniref:DUF3037 domain-containing protein n=1 Tax=Mucilaginibacter sp. TaxID=1882438 RepID=UPI0034E59838